MPIGTKTEGHSFENEREILYQILFDLRRDVTELKRIVGQQHYKMQPDDAASLTDHTALASMHADHPLRRDHKNFPLDDMPISEAEEITDAYEATTPPPPPAQPVAPPHDASLDEVERTMIAQALNKHNGRRKAAAVQLGISERTLYRKIKEYGLD